MNEKNRKKNSKSLNETKESTQNDVPAFKFKFEPSHQPNKANILSNQFLSVSQEFDGRYQKKDTATIDRSYWEVELLRRHPEIKDLISRVDPVTRAATLASLYIPNRRLHPQESLLALILQHLKILGLSKTADALIESFSFPLQIPEDLKYSQLVHHLERGILSADKFWSLLMPTPTYPTSVKEIQKQLAAQCTAALGVIGSHNERDTVPIFEESISNLENLAFNAELGVPSEGTINQLVWYVVKRYQSSDNIKFNSTLVEVFATTYHGFMPSSQMLQKLQEAWRMLQKDEFKDSFETLQLQFVALVEKWIEISFFDFDSSLLQNLSQWLATIQTSRPAMKKRMQTALRKQIEGKTINQMVEINLEGLKIPENLFFVQFELDSLEPLILARQITMHSSHYYYGITAKELLDCAWSKPSIRHRSPNVVGITNGFNTISGWVQATILNQPTINQRLRSWKYFSDLARELWNMHNVFDGLAIATALNGNALYRMRLHQEHLPEGTVDIMNEIVDATKSDNNFADLLAMHSSHQKSGPSLPYIGVYLTQLTFTYDGNADFIEGKVNFTKCFRVFKIIDTILSFQMKQYNFVIIEQIQEKLRGLPHYDETDLYNISLEVEPNKLTKEEFEDMLQTGK